jgi:two-component system chemotaxis response regulator CheY
MIARADRSLVGLKVLIVDDEPMALRLLQRLLDGFGAGPVVTAEDGNEALEAIKARGVPDVVICDWSMPRMSGLELLQRVRTINAELPFLMLTGSADVRSVMEAKRNGVTAYIRKPFSREELQRKLKVIARVQAHRNLRRRVI